MHTCDRRPEVVRALRLEIAPVTANVSILGPAIEFTVEVDGVTVRSLLEPAMDLTLTSLLVESNSGGPNLQPRRWRVPVTDRYRAHKEKWGLPRMRVWIDHLECSGAGVCVDACPVSDELLESALDAAEDCPQDCIFIST